MSAVDYEINEIDFIKTEKEGISFKINFNEKCFVSHLSIVLSRSEIGDFCNIIDLFRNMNISLIIGGCVISKIDIITNLLISSFHKRKIRENDDTIEIPLILFNLNKNSKDFINFENKLPLCLLFFHEVLIKFSGTNKCFQYFLEIS